VEGKKLRVYLFGKIEEKVNGRKWRMSENKFRILEKTSPILHSPFIIHHSSFSLSSLGAFPKKGIRQDGGDTPKMRTCHCERSEAIFSIEIASSLALLAMTHPLR